MGAASARVLHEKRAVGPASQEARRGFWLERKGSCVSPATRRNAPWRRSVRCLMTCTAMICASLKTSLHSERWDACSRFARLTTFAAERQSCQTGPFTIGIHLQSSCWILARVCNTESRKFNPSVQTTWTWRTVPHWWGYGTVWTCHSLPGRGKMCRDFLPV